MTEQQHRNQQWAEHVEANRVGPAWTSEAPSLFTGLWAWLAGFARPAVANYALVKHEPCFLPYSGNVLFHTITLRRPDGSVVDFTGGIGDPWLFSCGSGTYEPRQPITRQLEGIVKDWRERRAGSTG